jgi:hypothetical protein
MLYCVGFIEMNKLLISIAKNKFTIYVVWMMLVIPILAIATTTDIIYSPIIFILLVFYLRKERKHILATAFLYGFFVFYHPYFYFIRWFESFIREDIPLKECLEQIYSLLKVRSTTYFNPPSAIFAVLAIPSIYFINLRNKLNDSK